MLYTLSKGSPTQRDTCFSLNIELKIFNIRISDAISLGLATLEKEIKASKIINLTSLPKEAGRTVDAKSTKQNKLSSESDSFEKMLFKKAYFSGEFELDSVLRSLLHLVEHCEVFDLSETTFIYNKVNLRRKIVSTEKGLRLKLRSLEKHPEFNLVLFCLDNGIKLDKIMGEFPMIFTDYRRVLHCLKLSNAIYLTMAMNKHVDFPFKKRFFAKKSFSKGGYLTAIFVHLYSSMKKLGITDEAKIIKCIKTSLCFHVSSSLDQKELPEGPRINLIPPSFRYKFQRFDKKEEVKFFFSLLQSKSLCQEVPESFVLQALEKHHDMLSSPQTEISGNTLELLRERGRQFGKKVAKLYNPNHGCFPTSKASFAFPRNSGGMKGDLVSNGVLHNRLVSNDPTDRMEPFVIGLFGQPGQGKSSKLPELLGNLSKLFPGVSRKKLTYSRTCNVDHWDGYQNQPIVILDDLGQSLKGDDIQEFQTLVSCNQYILPMADLSEKGVMFNSPIIIVTSNLQYGHKLSNIYKESCGILDDASFWRRFHVPLYVEDRKFYQLKDIPVWVRRENLLKEPDSVRIRGNPLSDDHSGLYYQRTTPWQASTESGAIRNQRWLPIPEMFYQDLLIEFNKREKFHENIRKTWTQVVKSHTEDNIKSTGEKYWKAQIEPLLPTSLGFDCNPQQDSNTYSLDFSAYPPVDPLPVRIAPILEPLKVRIITAGMGETFSLKPFQIAMWQALDTEQQFCLTHGTNRLEPGIRRIYENSSEGDVWISGDYTAATDSIPMEATKALMEGILESIDHEPTKRWAMKEISPHLLVYPDSSGLDPVLQESGQLMGSFVSFPLLCLLNDCTALHSGLSPGQYLINGDDILMRAGEEVYPRWKRIVREFGLSLSPGKNYIHPIFGTVNSQLVCEDSILCAGKQRVLDRRTQVLGECLRDLEVMMSDTDGTEVQNLFKSVNQAKLARTVRSIHVPSSHGGLALSWGRRKSDSKSQRTEILCYLHDLFERVKPKSGCLTIPFLSQEKKEQKLLSEFDETFNEPVSQQEIHEDFVGIQSLNDVRKYLNTHRDLRTLFLGQTLTELPSLSFVDVVHIPFDDHLVKKELQTAIDQAFFTNFLGENLDFGYEQFHQSFLNTVHGISTTARVAEKYLVPLIELKIKPSYLRHIVTGYKAKSFDSTLFTKHLGKELVPKRFNLPSLEGTPDYSTEIISRFNQLQLGLRQEVHQRGEKESTLDSILEDILQDEEEFLED